jgi:hypothetical protein
LLAWKFRRGQTRPHRHAQPCRIDARKSRNHVIRQPCREVVVAHASQRLDWHHRDSNPAAQCGDLLGCDFLRRPDLFDGRNETITEPRECLDEARLFCLIVESNADLADAEIKALFKIDERVLTPDCVSNLVARHHRARITEEEGENSRWLLLNSSGHTFSTQFECLLVQFEFFKSNQTHTKGRIDAAQSTNRSAVAFVCHAPVQLGIPTLPEPFP